MATNIPVNVNNRYHNFRLMLNKLNSTEVNNPIMYMYMFVCFMNQLSTHMKTTSRNIKCMLLIAHKYMYIHICDRHFGKTVTDSGKIAVCLCF